MKKTNLTIRPASDRVLIRITQDEIENITSRWITRDDGKKVKLFIEPKFDKGFDRAFMQNVSVGTVMAVGKNVGIDIFEGDIVVLDYLVTNDIDSFVGYFKNDLVCCLKAETTYHDESSLPSQAGKFAWLKGDMDTSSKILGVIRGDKMIAFPPYIFLEARSNLIVRALANGKVIETVEPISTRTVISAPEDSGIEEGDEIKIKETDMFARYANGKEFWVVFETDVITVCANQKIEN